METLNFPEQTISLNTFKSNREQPDLSSLRLELRGRFADKVQIAATFQEAYRLLDRLCNSAVRELAVVYFPDFQVEANLMGVFERAAREALAYKDALSFGRDVPTRVEGSEKIHCDRTRAMVAKLHQQN